MCGSSLNAAPGIATLTRATQSAPAPTEPEIDPERTSVQPSIERCPHARFPRCESHGALPARCLEGQGYGVTHSQSLELIAKTFGYENWNILSAKIDVAQPRSGEAVGHQDPTPPAVLYCSFCGKTQHEVKALVAGPHVFICDECIDLCSDIIDEQLLRLIEGDEACARPCPPKGCRITSNTRARENNAIASSASVSNACLHFDATQCRWTMM